MSKYNISKLSRRFFPWFWQTDLNLRFIDVLMSSLDFTNQNIEDNETDFRQKAGYSIQRLSLETSLNDRFDADLIRITISNGDIGGSEFVFNEVETPAPELIIYIWNEAETPPNPETDPYVFNEGESGQVAATGFTVFVPSDLSGIQQEIEAWINRVLITGTDYNIVFV